MQSKIESYQASQPFVAWIALDMDSFDEALAVVQKTHQLVYGYKVHASTEDDLNNKLIQLSGAGAKRKWWDRKGHDTPDTVAAIARTAKKCGVDRMTVHAGGGIEMMMAAVAHGPPDIVAITDLTSLSKAEIGMLSGMPADASTLQKAQWAKLAGVSHLVCSSLEVGTLNERRKVSKVANRPLELNGLRLVVLGIRTISSDMGSQKRSSTASEALKSGADELVLGSEVWKTPDPVAAIVQIYDTIAA